MNSFFAPGRTELAGNHTDHQKGRVLASAVDKGIHAFVEPNFDNVARIRSAGFPDMDINLLDLDVHPEEFGSSAALVRGVASAMYDIGASFGGFDATLESELSAGSGLSSSAAFAVLMCRIFNGLYNNSELEPYAVARVAQQAENLHFGKPCGLMDQLACSLGKAVYIDFLTGEIIPVNADFSRMGLTLCLTDTGGSHAGLDTSYARIPADMRYIASFFGKERPGVLKAVQCCDAAAQRGVCGRTCGGGKRPPCGNARLALGCFLQGMIHLRFPPLFPPEFVQADSEKLHKRGNGFLYRYNKRWPQKKQGLRRKYGCASGLILLS